MLGQFESQARPQRLTWGTRCRAEASTRLTPLANDNCNWTPTYVASLVQAGSRACFERTFELTDVPHPSLLLSCLADRAHPCGAVRGARLQESITAKSCLQCWHWLQ